MTKRGGPKSVAQTAGRLRIFDEAICSNGIHRYAPAAYNSSRAPISGSASRMDSNGLPFSVPGRRCGSRLLGKFLLSETSRAESSPRAARRNRAPHPSPASLAALGQNAQLLLRAIVLAGKAEQLEQKSAAAGIRRVVAEMRRQRLSASRTFPRRKVPSLSCAPVRADRQRRIRRSAAPDRNPSDRPHRAFRRPSRPCRHFHALECEADRLGRILVAAGELHRGDQRILQIRSGSNPAACRHRLVVHDVDLLQNVACGAVVAQQRRGLVENLHDREVREVRPSGLRFLTGSAGAIRRVWLTPQLNERTSMWSWSCWCSGPSTPSMYKIRIYRHVVTPFSFESCVQLAGSSLPATLFRRGRQIRHQPSET